MERRFRLVCVLLIFVNVINGCRSLSNGSKVEMKNETSCTVLDTGIRQSNLKDNENTIIGLGVGTIVDTYARVIIGRKIDRIASLVSIIEGARVDSIRDACNLKALRITFDSGILFTTGKSNLNTKSMLGLTRFAEILVNNPTIDLSIMGHTDNRGLLSVNQRLSQDRAQAVADFLQLNSVSAAQLKVVIGKNSSEPLRDNNTTIGRAVNRRVEVYLYASKQMIQEAQQLAQ